MRELRVGAGQVDLRWIHGEISEKSYWAKGRTLDEMRTLLEQSRCYSVYEGDRQIGFARVVTDYAAFAYLADVWVDDEHRGQGVGRELIGRILEDPALAKVRRWLLATKDAQSFYRRFGFGALAHPERMMEIDLRHKDEDG